MIDDPFAAYPGSVVLDGGLATELERRGADLRDALWSARVLLDDPALIVEVHRAYIEAGADVVIGASYQASFEGLAARGLDRPAATSLLRRSVELAREATGDRDVRVAASVGPYGAILANGAEYTGDYGLGPPSSAGDALRTFHLPRVEALASAGPDLLAIETIPSIVETEALVEVLATIGDMPAWVSFSCRDEGHLHDGTSIEEAVDVVSGSPQVVAIGVNCTPPAAVVGLLRRAAAVTAKPLVAYPNRGATWDPVARAWTGDVVPEGFGPLARTLRSGGARLIGGCCGTAPADIAAVAYALRA
ncbi:MAG: homocysteine S-methyltransferase [Actinomycetota bacterium]